MREMSSPVNNCFARYLIDQKEMEPDGILPDVPTKGKGQ